MTTTSYDTVLYPTAIFRQCTPDRLAVIARLHGIAAPPAETARLLEVGGGDGLNATAVAAAYPNTDCVNFDIAALPVERGRHWAEAAGIANAHHHVLDILDAANALDGQFDYIIAHGIYAWVPEFVRKAVLALMARKLSPNGVAFISYNALPGGHSRQALRDLMLHHAGHIADPAQRLAAARSALRSFLAQPADQDEPVVAAMRKEAEATLTYQDGLLFHDQLGEIYAPQSLLAVATAAKRHGLAYLGESGRGGIDLGFLDADRADMGADRHLHVLQSRDYARGRYFRSSLFVRSDVPISRTLVSDAARDMWASTRAVPLGGGGFRLDRVEVKIGDPVVAAMIERLAGLSPGWLPVRDLVGDDAGLAGLCQRALDGYVDLHVTPPPFTTDPGDHPVASPLARFQIDDGQPRIATLDHRMLDIADESLRRFIASLDGTRHRASLAPALLRQVAGMALLVA